MNVKGSLTSVWQASVRRIFSECLNTHWSEIMPNMNPSLYINMYMEYTSMDTVSESLERRKSTVSCKFSFLGKKANCTRVEHHNNCMSWRHISWWYAAFPDLLLCHRLWLRIFIITEVEMGKGGVTPQRRPESRLQILKRWQGDGVCRWPQALWLWTLQQRDTSQLLDRLTKLHSDRLLNFPLHCAAAVWAPSWTRYDLSQGSTQTCTYTLT